jgi:hypothetical protein
MGASVFPLFDREGTVWKLMVVWRGSDRIVLLDFASGRIESRWWGFLIDAALSEERPLTLARVTGCAHLWHYDPWWVLRHHRYGGQAAAPTLRKTNLAGRTRRSILRLHFDPELSRVASFSTDRIGPMTPFDPELLPKSFREPVPAERPRRSGWVLRPIWSR